MAIFGDYVCTGLRDALAIVLRTIGTSYEYCAKISHGAYDWLKIETKSGV